MHSPKLDRKITLQRATTTTNEYGEEVQTWGTLATVWASKKDVSDGERIAAAAASAEIGTRFQIRWDSSWSDLSPLDRVVYDGRTYNISAVKEIGRREGLEISAAARAE